VPDSLWTSRHVGTVGDTDFFAFDSDVLVAAPHEGARNDAASARAHVALINEHFRRGTSPGAVIVLLDPAITQDAGARLVYRDETDATAVRCTALVGGTLLGRSIGSLVLKVSRRTVPTALFGTFEEALRWVRVPAPETADHVHRRTR